MSHEHLTNTKAARILLRTEIGDLSVERRLSSSDRDEKADDLCCAARRMQGSCVSRGLCFNDVQDICASKRRWCAYVREQSNIPPPGIVIPPHFLSFSKLLGDLWLSLSLSLALSIIPGLASHPVTKHSIWRHVIETSPKTLKVQFLQDNLDPPLLTSLPPKTT